MSSEEPLTILFEEADRRRPCPSFRLDSVQGRPVSLTDYRGADNLILYFAHNLACTHCREVLRHFEISQFDFRREGAIVLAVFPEPVQSLRGEGFLLGLHFPVLADPSGKTRSDYVNLMANELVLEADALLFVLDNYGCPYSALVSKEADGESFRRAALPWLSYISMQCPE